MTWLLRLAAVVAGLYLLRRLWRWFLTTGWKRLFVYTVEKATPAPAPPADYVGTFQRDPVCGTHVDSEVAVRDTFDGQTFYFCSPACRDTYRARQREIVHKTG